MTIYLNLGHIIVPNSKHDPSMLLESPNLLPWPPYLSMTITMTMTMTIDNDNDHDKWLLTMTIPMNMIILDSKHVSWKPKSSALTSLPVWCPSCLPAKHTLCTRTPRAPFILHQNTPDAPYTLCQDQEGPKQLEHQTRAAGALLHLSPRSYQ